MTILEICGLFILCMNMHGQYRIDPAVQNGRCSLTSNLQYDLSTNINGDNGADSSEISHPVVSKRPYSPLKASLFSLVIPGAGQLYTKNYWQSATFFGAEVLTWVVYAALEKKADQQTDAFNNFADEHWSVIRYAYWIRDNYPAYYNKMIVPGQQAANIASPWLYVNWNQLNTAESEIAGDQNIQPTGFTHQLESYGDQQYYEMIGKYSQFGGGWDDAATFKQNGYTKADVLANKGIGNVSPRQLEYEKMRGQANSTYDIGTTVSCVIVANHIFSALEAAWNASKLNHRIKLEGHIESRQVYGNNIEFVPTLHLEYEL